MKALIFDFDGTLVDSMPCWGGAMLRLLESHNISYPDDIIKQITPLGNAGAVNYFKENFALALSEREAIEFIVNDMLPNYRDLVLIKSGVAEFLSKAKQQGYILAVLTASPHVTLDPCLKRNGVFDIFDEVWSCEDFAMTKSNPEIYCKTAEQLGVNLSDCVFFDDNIHSVATAKLAGMTAIGVYDESGEAFAEELKQIADGYIYSFSEFDLNEVNE